MKVTFRSNLGTVDAKAFGIDSETCRACRAGETVDLPAATVKALTAKYPGLFEEEAEEVKGVATKPAITAPAKSSDK